MSTRSLPSLPVPSARRLAVRVTPDAERRLRAGHPWLYEGSITSVSHEGQPGDLAVVFDRRRRFCAVGLWDPASPIRVKILARGRPTTIDDAWWHRCIGDSIARRDPLVATGDTTGLRLVHGENDGLPGLVVDRYDRTLVVKLYSAALFAHLGPVLDALAAAVDPERVVVRLARRVGRGPTHGLVDGDVVVGSAPTGPVPFFERGLTFLADVETGQKTGHFLDQRDTRALVGGLAAGARVLDVFACTGGFSVHAAAGGAASVHLVDRSDAALATARRNLAANAGRPEVAACSVATTTGDAFEVLAELADGGVRHDLVVVDPPSFAQRRGETERALAAYARLTRLALAVLEPAGVLVQASCSSRVTEAAFHDTVRSAAAAEGVTLAEITRTTQPLDHPVGFAEGAYLKALVARVRSGTEATA